MKWPIFLYNELFANYRIDLNLIRKTKQNLKNEYVKNQKNIEVKTSKTLIHIVLNQIVQKSYFYKHDYTEEHFFTQKSILYSEDFCLESKSLVYRPFYVVKALA